MRRLSWVGVVVGLSAAPSLAAQVSFSNDAIEEIQTISIQVDVVGGTDNGRLSALLEDLLRQELTRADITYERADPRSGDCCVLRLDVRRARGSGRSRFGEGFTARLELGYHDRLGNVPTWTTIWAGRLFSNVVELADFNDNVRFAARDLVGEFIDRYRERFPRR